MEELLSTPKAAQYFGLDRKYAAMLAKESYLSGNPYPMKKGKTYIAPLSEWEKIFRPVEKRLRKPRKITPDENKIKPDNRSITASKAAILIGGISPMWALELGKRSRNRGDHYPQLLGHMLVAPLEEWKRIFSDESLRKK